MLLPTTSGGEWKYLACDFHHVPLMVAIYMVRLMEHAFHIKQINGFCRIIKGGSMKCESCGNDYHPDEFFYEGQRVVYCRSCYEARSANSTDKSGMKEIRQAVGDSTDFQANTLLAVSKFQSFVGWLVTVIGGFGAIGSLVAMSKFNIMIGLVAFAGSVLLVVIGILGVSIGQTIRCFVQIERNTNKILERLSD